MSEKLLGNKKSHCAAWSANLLCRLRRNTGSVVCDLGSVGRTEMAQAAQQDHGNILKSEGIWISIDEIVNGQHVLRRVHRHGA
jgi:hypothetical protein